MIRTDPHSFALPRYSYARVEAALAAVFGIDAERRGPLKGRLKHLNTLGLPGLNVGRGIRIAYSFDQAAQWLIALLIEETGVDPTVAVRLVKGAWEGKIERYVRLALDDESLAGDHVFLTFTPRLMTDSWAKGESPPNPAPFFGFLRHRHQNDEDVAVVGKALKAVAKSQTWVSLRDLTVDLEILMKSLEGAKS